MKNASPEQRSTNSSSTAVVYAALIGDILVAISKVGAAIWTGSAAMTSEAIHSIVDTTNEILLLYGIHRSRQKPDTDHPFGHGRELYFWSFVVSLLIFALGAGFSIYEGVQALRAAANCLDRKAPIAPKASEAASRRPTLPTKPCAIPSHTSIFASTPAATARWA